VQSREGRLLLRLRMRGLLLDFVEDKRGVAHTDAQSTCIIYNAVDSTFCFYDLCYD